MTKKEEKETLLRSKVDEVWDTTDFRCIKIAGITFIKADDFVNALENTAKKTFEIKV